MVGKSVWGTQSKEGLEHESVEWIKKLLYPSDLVKGRKRAYGKSVLPVSVKELQTYNKPGN